MLDVLAHIDPMNELKRWMHRLPYVIALVILMGVVLSMAFLASTPYDGILQISTVGVIGAVDSDGPANGKLRQGDVILGVDGEPLHSAIPLYNAKAVGDLVEFNVSRDGEQLRTHVRLMNPPFQEFVRRTVPGAVAALFCLVGVWVISYNMESTATWLFYLFSVGSSIALLAGSVSLVGSPWVSGIFRAAFWLLGPLGLHFHVCFLSTRTHPRSRELALVNALYVVGVFGTIPVFLLGHDSLYSQPWLEAYVESSRLFLVFNLLLVVGLLFLNHRRFGQRSIRAKIRLVTLGGASGLLPVGVLSVLPDTLFGQPALPYHISFMLLGIIPLTYGYAILHHRLVDVEDYVSRAALQVLVIALVSGIYLLAITTLLDFLPFWLVQDPISLTVLVLFLAIVFAPLKTRVHRFLDKAIYGSWYDYHAVVVSTGRDISKPMDQSSLAGYLLSILSKMRYQSAAVFWVRAGRLVVQEYFGYEEPFESLRVPANGQLGQVLLSVNNPVWRDQLTALVDPDLLENDERALMSLPRGHLWLPLANRGQLLGMIVLTPLHQEMWTSAEDLDILGTLATFGGVAADNVALVKQLEGQLAKVEYAREELAESQRRLLQGREDERLRLARELHDGPIQDLHAIRLRLGSANKNGGWLEYEEIQSSLIEIIHHLRDLCAHLRPPALETFGLSVALNSLADQARKTESTLTVGIKVADVCEQIPDHVKLALYRICQESLNNTLQHADARKVTIRIFCQENYIQLRVQDDGRGFEVPDRWVQLARHGHLGLLGIAERAESIGGRLDVYSANGRGTTVVVTAPFPCYEADDQVSINVLRSEGEYDSRSIGR